MGTSGNVAVLLGIVVTGCSAPSHTPAASSPLPLPVASSAPSRACSIEGPSANLTVKVVAGEDAFDVPIRGARVTVTPRGGAMGEVEVTGALAFEGKVEGLELFPSRRVVVAGGMVELGPMSVLADPSPRDGAIDARTAVVGSGFEVSGAMSIPCSALSFVGSGDASEEAHRGIRGPSLRSHECPAPCVYYHTPEVLELHASPGDASVVRLTGSTIVSALERRDRWTLVSTEDAVHMSAQLVGWVEGSSLQRIDGGIGFTGGRSFLSTRASRPPRIGYGGPGVVQGLAHVDVGTPVFSRDMGGGRWATIRDGDAEFAVVIWPTLPRALVMRAPSFPYGLNAWVSVTAVHVFQTPAH
jgi:hypothetical protein